MKQPEAEDQQKIEAVRFIFCAIYEDQDALDLWETIMESDDQAPIGKVTDFEVWEPFANKVEFVCDAQEQLNTLYDAIQRCLDANSSPVMAMIRNEMIAMVDRMEQQMKAA